MNERIRELAEQATIHSPGGFYTYTQIDAKKFAELIARAYGNIVLHYTDVDEGVKVANKHFGVEK